MRWSAKPTGDMTLSVVDEKGFQILKIDMLSYDTMKAGTNGDRLVRALNNLTILAGFGDASYFVEMDDLPFPDETISVLPWKIDYSKKKRRIVVFDGNHRKIAERTYPKKTTDNEIDAIAKLLAEGCEFLSKASDVH